MRFRYLTLLPLLSLVLSACGGSMGGTSVPNAPSTPAPAARQSVGGIWVNPAGTGLATDVATIFVAETGELILSDASPAFGAGALVVNGTNEVAGSYFKNTAQTSPFAPRVPDANCTVTGSVTERVSMTLEVRCVDTDSAIDESTKNFVLLPSYTAGSSLAAIAGNYTTEFNSAENTLTVNNDGTLFGMLLNGGINCVVNGTAQIIDPDYILFGVEFEFANCIGVFDEFEGAVLRGFGVHGFSINRPDSIYMLMSGEVGGNFRWLTMLYDPV